MTEFIISGLSVAAYVVATGYVKKKLLKLAKVKNYD